MRTTGTRTASPSTPPPMRVASWGRAIRTISARPGRSTWPALWTPTWRSVAAHTPHGGVPPRRSSARRAPRFPRHPNGTTSRLPATRTWSATRTSASRSTSSTLTLSPPRRTRFVGTTRGRRPGAGSFAMVRLARIRQPRTLTALPARMLRAAAGGGAESSRPAGSAILGSLTTTWALEPATATRLRCSRTWTFAATRRPSAMTTSRPSSGSPGCSSGCRKCSPIARTTTRTASS
mmetsp:Transcript_28905/g.74915  ORF Transcript_28905/g.74915 Transcript_28905/m.74915 type:complete len:235 (-) Transcript_28905:268-972(-)